MPADLSRPSPTRGIQRKGQRMKRLGTLLICWSLLTPVPASAFSLNLDITPWDVFKSIFVDETADDRTPLEMAIDQEENTDEALVKKLEQINSILNKKFSNNSTNKLSSALRRASGNSGVAVVELLLKAGADVNARSAEVENYGVFHGRGIPLAHAVANKNPLVARRLLDAGANPNAKILLSTSSIDGTSILAVAAKAGNPVVVKMLLERGAQVNHICELTCVPVLHAAINGHHDHTGFSMSRDLTKQEKLIIGERYLEVVRLLLEHGADVDYSADIVRFESALLLALKNDGPQFVPLLLDHGVKFNAPINGQWPIIAAVWSGQAESVRLLLDRGADLKVTNDSGENVLTAAFKGLGRVGGNPEIVERLLAAGAIVTPQNNNNGISLIEAIEGVSLVGCRGTESVITEEQKNALLVRMVNLGADLNVKDSRGNTALMLARSLGYSPVVHAILMKEKKVKG